MNLECHPNYVPVSATDANAHLVFGDSDEEEAPEKSRSRLHLLPGDDCGQGVGCMGQGQVGNRAVGGQIQIDSIGSILISHISSSFPQSWKYLIWIKS